MKKIRVVEINGIRGILMVIYAAICAIAGFVLFPSWGFMMLWNYVSTHIYTLPQMNLLHGFLSYAIIVLVFIATKSQKSCVGITSADITKSNIAAIMKDIEDENKGKQK